VVLPCGGGKSVIVAEIAKRTTAKHNHVLFLVHRKELVDQIQNTFDFWGVDMNNADIMMVQTASRRIDSIEYPSLIITDECFPAGTMVDDKPIEEITPGDYVSSYNEINGTIEKKRVIAVMKNPMPDQLVEIDNNLLTTSNHPIYEPLEGRYIDAGNFKQGQFTLHCVPDGTRMGRTYSKPKSIFRSSGGTRIYCSRECSKEYCRRISSITMAKTNRKYASERMKKNNPSRRADVKAKISTTKKGKPFPTKRGGNGRGMTVPQMMLMKELSPYHPEAEYVVKTAGILKYPPAYKVDVALPNRMIAVEVDGNSHHSLKVKEADERKTSVLEQKGWKVLRFTNQQILENLDACVEKILSTT